MAETEEHYRGPVWVMLRDKWDDQKPPTLTRVDPGEHEWFVDRHPPLKRRLFRVKHDMGWDGVERNWWVYRGFRTPWEALEDWLDRNKDQQAELRGKIRDLKKMQQAVLAATAGIDMVPNELNPGGLAAAEEAKKTVEYYRTGKKPK